MPTGGSLAPLPRALGYFAHYSKGSIEAVHEAFEIIGDDNSHVWADAGPLALGSDPFDQRSGIGERLMAEGERQALRAGLELLDVGAAAQSLDLHEAHEQANLRRGRAEAVDDFGRHRVDLGLVLERREAAIESKPGRQVGNIRFGDRHRGAKLD